MPLLSVSRLAGRRCKLKHRARSRSDAANGCLDARPAGRRDVAKIKGQGRTLSNQQRRATRVARKEKLRSLLTSTYHGCPRRLAWGVSAALLRPSETTRNCAARSLGVGHSKILTIERFCFSSLLIIAITWTALKDVPPASKKLSSKPIPGRPNAFFQISTTDVCKEFAPARFASASRGSFP